ncbi:MAG: hypothetical protein LBI31_04025, partial [Zoogloeaceae bacterium]|nr:hypothetical protein [Zoogloeaceae bacterium]
MIKEKRKILARFCRLFPIRPYGLLSGEFPGIIRPTSGSVRVGIAQRNGGVPSQGRGGCKRPFIVISTIIDMAPVSCVPCLASAYPS